VTTIYLSGAGATGQLEAVRRWDWENKPLAILVSFAYLRGWRQIGAYFRRPSALMLDSGAFTAYTLGKPVDHDALIREAHRPEWTEAVGLDVIGDWQATRRNAEREAAMGATKMMPTFHLGDPWEALEFYCERFPKVAIGGMVGAPKLDVLRFLGQVFARAWPKRLHSFGRCEEEILSRFPFESADAVTWAMASSAYGRFLYKKRGVATQKALKVGRDMVVCGVQQYMDAIWRREQTLKARWAAELAPLRQRPTAATDQGKEA
jgi:hypothetical protein